MLVNSFKSKLTTSKPSLLRLKSTSPPTYFQQFNSKPDDANQNGGQQLYSPLHPSAQSIPNASSFPNSSSNNDNSKSKLASIRDLSIVFSIITLIYFAVDNYRVRSLMEASILEQSLQHMKSLAITQNNFNNQRKKREIQIINERKKVQKREMKMVYHISLLRKQLIDAGIDPGE